MPFNKSPFVKIKNQEPCLTGWDAILEKVSQEIEQRKATSIVIECYQGIMVEDMLPIVEQKFPTAKVINSATALKSEGEIIRITHPSVTDDRIFGVITNLNMKDLFDDSRISEIKKKVAQEELVFVIGTGASLLIDNPRLLIYADMARWEIQLRMRKNAVANIGLANRNDKIETKYKRGFFLDWRLCDNLKKELMSRWDFILDTNNQANPKMISAAMFSAAMEQTVRQPFSVVPFFDPGPWGGQWMKEKFNLDPEASNYAWCFNCVPEENSLLLDFNGVKFETPSINLVFSKPKELLGQHVQKLFGDEFPIRFDFLDTIDGGNLSLQVHPLKEYIREKFGMPYTQDESYYILDATDDATVYLGLKENVDQEGMIADLRKAQSNGHIFDADKYAQRWSAKKHDHFLIPAGTVHCSATGCMVLEISATPYIFTFKLWDWARLGLDGKPRPINIDHGINVIQWDRQPAWTEANLVNKISTVTESDEWREEQTGLHALQFIETRRYWHSGTVSHRTDDTVNVLMVVEGEQAVVESPDNSFEPFLVNYAEAFIVPANVEEYTIRPTGLSEGKEIGVIKAYVRK
ncbi:MAG: class I mannose-6-phosphate isomerase [Cyclobacteriaceae bacterium]|nr:class I mannose-6-phosphate isomerase [Cyclobacteriaceae bacterium]